MPAKKVYFVTLKSKMGRNLLKKINEGLNRLYNSKPIVKKGSLVAIKLHFGEWGNLSFVRPQYAGEVVNFIKEKGGIPFLTDTNTLYKGHRSSAPEHIITALKNGFGLTETGAPVVIADGIRGHNKVRIKIDCPVVKEAVLAGDIVSADSMFVISHFKGHELTGFGGAIKNLGMGCAAREGKLFMHSTVSPQINERACRGCETCIDVCPAEAIVMQNRKAKKVEQKCIGCADCIIACPEGAISIKWNETSVEVMKKVAEYAYAVVSVKKGRILYSNFIMQVSPLCDCYGFNDTAIAPDIGVCLSDDPVAIDQASIDLILKSLSGNDPFKKISRDVDWNIWLDHAQNIGLGNRQYALEIIE